MKCLFALFAVLVSLAVAFPAQASPGTSIYVNNVSTVLTDRTIQDAMTCFQRAWDNDFGPAWNAPGKLIWGIAPEGAQQITVSDWSDVFGALAYHDTNFGVPYAKVFAATNLDLGYNWEVAFTHELWEMLADPYTNRVMDTTRGFYSLEVGDPVEKDSFGYWRVTDGGNFCTISDFVTEAWFRSFSTGPWDFTYHTKRPLQILREGYQRVLLSNNSWRTILGPQGYLGLLRYPDLP